VFIPFMLLVARPVAVLVSFLGTRIPRLEQLFMAWFGPKGVASMLFALLAAESAAPDASVIFAVASMTIIVSITVHGSPTRSAPTGSRGRCGRRCSSRGA
jgi:NhaP-type Na+/H+ or K+/H+ antiporter